MALLRNITSANNLMNVTTLRLNLKKKVSNFQTGNFFFASDSNSKLKISISFWKFLWSVMRATSKFFVFLICICRRQYQKFSITGNAKATVEIQILPRHYRFRKRVSHKLWQPSKLKLNSPKLPLASSPKPKLNLIK